MFKVVDFAIDDELYFSRVLYTSANYHDCWDFIRNRLSHTSPIVRDEARHLFVVNRLENFTDPPPEVRALRRNVCYSPYNSVGVSHECRSEVADC